MNFEKKTIFALSSGRLPSAIAIIRLSGPKAFQACQSLCKDKVSFLRTISLKNFIGKDGKVLDKGLLLCFPAPHSFTGEDCVEFQVHGGPAVVRAILKELGNIPGLYHAEPGEFSRQAFENGKLDLLELEGLSDLIFSETEMQRRLSHERVSGSLSNLYNRWSQKLTVIRAFIEAELDFSDEEDIKNFKFEEIWQELSFFQEELKNHIFQGKLGEIIRDGYKIAIVGHPNAGKSSLFNALAKRDVSIVTNIPGTTRDILTLDLDLDGYLVKILDTAGIHETDDKIEKEGIRRAQLAIKEVDLVLLLKEISSDLKVDFIPKNIDVLFIGTKNDLHHEIDEDYDQTISIVTGEGLNDLINKIKNIIDNKFREVSMVIPSQKRHLEHLSQVSFHLDNVFNQKECGLDIVSENLRLAAVSLGKITGSIDIEQLLDVIFSKFCIGK
ncbi:GTPase and tRNA-U34 5-formylation enzyme TrmE [Liberibacter crescens BT-1]|uniref:tRNA modification GTPase MnmE n=1 Tax=Liberibacter crescens (strain BT-1) TaxID=1215343 RepID=L0ETN3_LIBCB|nr:tRNA uridine-5-carboxymethylaminomethyl(34) synthesis GTPase MnmE [Liberibacter crescens]AGA63993.1 GTPase and tRNA-U34 5-formylation enzyme TrmE [Liberibacter crescens BT-1]AMC12305.1 tRNA modification GTPase TrmE [Liberibacter crescens]